MACILVIDDEQEICNVIQEFLENAGHQVHTATDGNEGLQYCREHIVDLVITDLHMPVLDGLEMIKVLQHEVRAPRLIAMSGEDRFMVRTNLESSQLHGAERTFLKPFDMSALLEAIEELMAEPAL